MSRNLADTFNEVATTYDKYRPGYVDELYEDIFRYVSITDSDSCLEIGIGTGLATLPFLNKCGQLTAVEYGHDLADLCSQKFSHYENFDVKEGKFEELPIENDSYKLIYAATAFHWIPEKEGYEKVYSLLEPGGAFARFANHPFRKDDGSGLCEEIDEAYNKYFYPYYNQQPKVIREYSEEDVKRIAELPLKYGFTDTEYHIYHRERHFTADEYISLLGTYSNHIAIEESVKKPFFEAIHEAIIRHGDVITIRDTIDLELARK
ncbi:MAG: class I SAM-dependent methyltransferase [Eubacteriales bacterium]|nr:class I SAM-dependent methyltransferase [Eubacteriales bacterium]